MSTLTHKMLADYNGIAQTEAVEMLDLQSVIIVDAEAGISRSKLVIGRILNEMEANGLTVAAAADIDGDARDWSDDGRSTALSTYVKHVLPNVTSNKVSDWRKMAHDFDTLEDAGVDTSEFAVSAFLALQSDADSTTFVETVTAVADANEGKVTAGDFVDAGREAGIVAEGRGSKTKVTVSKADAPRIGVLTPANALLVAARDAVEAGVTFTKAQRKMLAEVSELTGTLSDEG